MDKYFMWMHYERLHNHNKAKHNKTVCIFLGIYCTSSQIPTKTSTVWFDVWRRKSKPNNILDLIYTDCIWSGIQRRCKAMFFVLRRHKIDTYVLHWFEMVLWYNEIIVWDHSLSQYKVYVAVWNCLNMTYSDSIVLQLKLMFCCLNHMRTLDATCHISSSVTARNIDFNPSRQGAILPRLTLITVKNIYVVHIVKLNQETANLKYLYSKVI